MELRGPLHYRFWAFRDIIPVAPGPGQNIFWPDPAAGPFLRGGPKFRHLAITLTTSVASDHQASLSFHTLSSLLPTFLVGSTHTIGRAYILTVNSDPPLSRARVGIGINGEFVTREPQPATRRSHAVGRRSGAHQSRPPPDLSASTPTHPGLIVRR